MAYRLIEQWRHDGSDFTCILLFEVNDCLWGYVGVPEQNGAYGITTQDKLLEYLIFGDATQTVSFTGDEGPSTLPIQVDVGLWWFGTDFRQINSYPCSHHKIDSAKKVVNSLAERLWQYPNF